MTLRTRLARLERTTVPAWTGDLPSVPGAGTGAILAILEAAGAGEWVRERLEALQDLPEDVARDALQCDHALRYANRGTP